MKRRVHKHHATRATLADLVATVTKLTRNERLSAAIVADLINSRQVRLGGTFQNKRVLVA